MRFCILLFLFLLDDAWAISTRNEGIHELVTEDPDRIIPASDLFAATLDAELFWSGLGERNLFHGTGHWLDIRTELTPNPYLTLNLKSIFFNATSSNGYIGAAGDFHLFGVTGRSPGRILGLDAQARWGDLSRVTSGLGLVVEEREMNGVSATLSNHILDITVLGNGAGAFKIDDEYRLVQMSLKDQVLGISLSGQLNSKVYFGTLFSKVRLSDYLNIFAEAGYSHSDHYKDAPLYANRRNLGWAGLAGAQYAYSPKPFAADVKVQTRYYQEAFAANIRGGIQHGYLSYDSFDKSYVSTMNIFTLSGKVWSSALNAKLKYYFNDRFRLLLENEVGYFDYDLPTNHYFTQEYYEFFYFFKNGFQYCPIEGRDDCITAYVSNKNLLNGTSAGLVNTPVDNEPFFTKTPLYVGLLMTFAL